MEQKKRRSLFGLLVGLILFSCFPVMQLFAREETDVNTFELTAHVVDESGNAINLGSFAVEYCATLTPQSDQGQASSLTVTASGSSGMGIAYAYSLEDGNYTLTVTRPVAIILDSDEHSWTFDHAYLQKEEGEPIEGLTAESVELAGGEPVVYNLYCVYTQGESVSFEICWDDDNNRDGKRPSSVEVSLYADSQDTGLSKTLTAADEWKGQFNGLDKYKDGNEISYQIIADTPEDYTFTADGYRITFEHTPETGNIAGAVVWEDGNDRDGIRPSSVTVTLWKNGTATETTMTVNEENGWCYEFGDLPVYEDGKLITYTVSGTEVTGYTAEVTERDIVYSHTPETPEIDGEDGSEGDADENGSENGNSGTSQTEVKSETKSETKTTVSSGVNTGDHTPVLFVSVLAAGSLLAAAGMIFRKRHFDI